MISHVTHALVQNVQTHVHYNHTVVVVRGNPPAQVVYAVSLHGRKGICLVCHLVCHFTHNALLQVPWCWQSAQPANGIITYHSTKLLLLKELQ